MAKLSFTKINKPTKPIDVITIDFQNEKIEIKQYLSTKDKVNFLDEYCTYFLRDKVFNIFKDSVYKKILTIKYYTNVAFTEKQMENIETLYDKIVLSGLYEAIYEVLKENEDYCLLRDTLPQVASSIISYRSSFLGIIESLSEQKNLNDILDLEKVLEEIKDPQIKELLANFKNLESK